MEIKTSSNNTDNHLLEDAIKKHCWSTLDSLEEILKAAANFNINHKLITMLQHIANSYATAIGLTEITDADNMIEESVSKIEAITPPEATIDASKVNINNSTKNIPDSLEPEFVQALKYIRENSILTQQNSVSDIEKPNSDFLNEPFQAKSLTTTDDEIDYDTLFD